MSELIIAIIGAVGGACGALIVGLFQRKKTKAETNKLNADAASVEADTNEQIRLTVMSLIEPLQNRIKDLERRVDQLESRIARYLKRIVYLMDGIRCLIEQLENAGMHPVWRPDEWKPDEEE
jgi:uncharacterized protein HemX